MKHEWIKLKFLDRQLQICCWCGVSFDTHCNTLCSSKVKLVKGKDRLKVFYRTTNSNNEEYHE